MLEQERSEHWIDSGGDEPRLFDDDRGNEGPEDLQDRGARRWKALLRIGFAGLLLGLACQLGHARDRGQFANSSPEIKAWFEGLRSGKGPCCSDADGTAISDADWESKDGHYRVRVPATATSTAINSRSWSGSTCRKTP